MGKGGIFHRYFCMTMFRVAVLLRENGDGECYEIVNTVYVHRVIAKRENVVNRYYDRKFSSLVRHCLRL